MGTLYVVATPIGNIEDITLRAVRVLKEADVILAEDTRSAARLLARLKIAGKTVWRYDEHSHERMLSRILDGLRNGQSFALTTDAGTPGISDPGARLVRAAVELEDVRITPIPRPSALTAVLSVAGFSADRFVFLGFPPHKKGRSAFFKDVASRDETVVLFESPHRIEKTLAELGGACSLDRRLLLAREITKLHEEIIRGTIAEVTARIKTTTIKGEFVLIVGPCRKK